MGAHVIDGRGLAAELKEELAAEVAGLMDAGVVTGLATVLVGSPAEALSPVPGGVDPITDVWPSMTPPMPPGSPPASRQPGARRRRRTRVYSQGWYNMCWTMRGEGSSDD